MNQQQNSGLTSYTEECLPSQVKATLTSSPTLHDCIGVSLCTNEKLTNPSFISKEQPSMFVSILEAISYVQF